MWLFQEDQAIYLNNIGSCHILKQEEFFMTLHDLKHEINGDVNYLIEYKSAQKLRDRDSRFRDLELSIPRLRSAFRDLEFTIPQNMTRVS